MSDMKNKIQNEKLLHAQDLENFFVSIIKEQNLMHIVDKILITSEGISGFCCEEKLIIINLNELWYKIINKENIRTSHDKHIITSSEIKKNTCSNPNRVNIYNIATFYHEVKHAKQAEVLLYLIENNSINTLYEAILYKGLLTRALIEILGEPHSINMHNKYHNYFFEEYDANINGYINVIEFFNKLNLPNLKEVLELYNKLIASNLYMLYKDIQNIKVNSTPALNMIKLYNTFYKLCGDKFEDEFLSFDKIKDIDMPKEQIDRLKLGLRLEDKTLSHIYKIAKGKEKTLNLFNDINNI